MSVTAAGQTLCALRLRRDDPDSRPGNLDQVAVGELTSTGQGQDRRLRSHRDARDVRMTPCGALSIGASFAAELRKRGGFDLPDQVGEHVVKNADLRRIKVCLRCPEKESVTRLRISVRAIA